MTAEIVPGIVRPPRREDYESIVRGLRPMCDGEELRLRSSLLLMRDRAMATKPSSSPAGWALLDVVEQVASTEALNARVPVEELREMRRLCVQCVMTAKGFDMLYQPPLPGIETGEASK